MLRHDSRQPQLYGEHHLLYDILRQDDHNRQLQEREELPLLPVRRFSGSMEIIVGCLNPPNISAILILPQTHLQRHVLAGGPFLEGRACKMLVWVIDAGTLIR